MLAARLPLATGWGLFISLATFWLLWFTINAPLVVENSVIVKPEFRRTIDDSDLVRKEPPPPRPVKPVRNEPDAIGPPAPPVEVPRTPPTRERAGPATPIEVTPPSGPGTPTSGTDGDPMCWVCVKPEYPMSAARRGIEGWVLVQFSVTATGQVTDVTIVEANPPDVFDKATIQAVQRWRYRPKVRDGQPVDGVGLRTLIRFDLP